MAKHKRIDYSDIPATDTSFWEDAVVHAPKIKQTITIRLDPDVIAWFKEDSSHYQTKINAVLKSYKNAHSR